MTFCRFCGTRVEDQARYCQSCGHAQLISPDVTSEVGSSLSTTSNISLPIGSTMSPEVLAKLKPFAQWADVLCMECGYKGLMGVVSLDQQVVGCWNTCVVCSGCLWLIVAIPTAFVFPIGTIIAIVIGVVATAAIHMSTNKRLRLSCPSCNRELVIQSPAVMPSIVGSGRQA